MKKIIASAVGLMMVGGVAATTASAVENQFGGYWRTRIFVQDNFDGQDSGTYYRASNRTRLYYTAKFNDDFKFVNKFEFNTTWGDDVGGDIGADGMGIWRIKNSYADFNTGNVRWKLGIQGAALARGFLFDDDFSGAVVTPSFGDTKVSGMYIAVNAEDDSAAGFQEGMWVANAAVKISDAFSLTPYFVYHNGGAPADIENWYLGADVDMKMDALSGWGSFIYNGGKIAEVDNKGFLLAAGVDAGIAHGQAFYATGDDNATDGDNDAFVSAPGQCYYWSEIMGFGIFDNAVSAGSPGCAITNVMAFNGGVTIKPMDKLSLVGDVWYAQLAEDNAFGEKELGWEFDAKATYSVMDNLNLDLVFAYLVSGKATGDEDIYETGLRLSLSF